MFHEESPVRVSLYTVTVKYTCRSGKDVDFNPTEELKNVKNSVLNTKVSKKSFKAA